MAAQHNDVSLRGTPPGLRKARPEWLAAELHKTRAELYHTRTDAALFAMREPKRKFWSGFWRGAITASLILLFVWQIAAGVDLGMG